ncbi:hypothetical protein [Ancylobacter terrae]|uniref:hypothetical protein n=1 Tax=Ancylobacter sp. sgz301288 TaxID=3342077 RepID=UPI00385D3AEE
MRASFPTPRRRAVFAVALAAVLGAPLAAGAQAPPSAPEPEAATPALPGPLACTLTTAFICEPAKGCSPSKTFGDIPLPAQMLVDFPRQLLAATSPSGLPHVSSINSLAAAGDALIAQGVDGSIGWVLQTSRSASDLSFTTVDHDTVLTVFGTCKPPA